MPPVDAYDLGHELGQLAQEIAGLRRDFANAESARAERCREHIARVEKIESGIGWMRGVTYALVVCVGFLVGKAEGAIAWVVKAVGW